MGEFLENSFLSVGGRLVLIKHVLASIPIHLLAAAKVPKGIFHAIEKLIFCEEKMLIGISFTRSNGVSSVFHRRKEE